jgi:hypothetical protein
VDGRCAAMGQKTLTTGLNCDTVPDGKWGSGVAPNQTVGEAAGQILAARLPAVWSWLPLAAQRSEEDVECVHQLRVAPRRAMAALRLFADLLPEQAGWQCSAVGALS